MLGGRITMAVSVEERNLMRSRQLSLSPAASNEVPNANRGAAHHTTVRSRAGRRGWHSALVGREPQLKAQDRLSAAPRMDWRSREAPRSQNSPPAESRIEGSKPAFGCGLRMDSGRRSLRTAVARDTPNARQPQVDRGNASPRNGEFPPDLRRPPSPGIQVRPTPDDKRQGRSPCPSSSSCWAALRWMIADSVGRGLPQVGPLGTLRGPARRCLWLRVAVVPWRCVGRG
jgi:hypothetical protein